MKKTFKTTAAERELYNLPETMSCDDHLHDLIDTLNRQKAAQDYDNASSTLNTIKNLLHEDYDSFRSSDPCRRHGRILLSVHDILRSYSIRLDWRQMDFGLYLRLLQRLDGKLDDHDIRSTRIAIAREMVSLNLPPQEGRGRTAPNRAFMDELFKIKGTFANKDLLRREQTKLRHSIQHNDDDTKQAIKQNIRKIRDADLE